VAQRAARNPSQSASKTKSKRSRQPAADQGDGSQRASPVAGSLAHAPRHERERADQALVASASMLEDVVQVIGDGILLLSKDLRILWANRPAVEQTGRELDELLGSHCYEATHHRDSPCEPPPDPCPVRLVEKTGEPATATHTHYDAAGNQRRVEVAVYPLTDESGEIVKFVHVSRDVTELKWLEKALLETEERFSQVAETAREWISEVDAEGRYTYSSPAVKDILGYEAEEVIGKRFFDFYPPEEKKRLLAQAKDIGAQKDTYVHTIVPNVHKDGHTVLVECSGRPMLDADGNVIGYRSVGRDVTERERTQEALEEALEKARVGLEDMVERRFKRRNVYGLTFRELTVLRMITAGQTDRGIAAALGISHLTAQKHTSNILRKMKAASRTEAGARAIREGLVD
jgi:sigma-B regulation protein RsbU (phosphoserine phosphatase)